MIKHDICNSISFFVFYWKLSLYYSLIGSFVFLLPSLLLFLPLFFLCLCRTSSTMWQISRTMVWWRSLTPKGMMHGRCTLRRLPRRLSMSLPCVMEWSPSTRPWRMLPFLGLLSEYPSQDHTVCWYHTLSPYISVSHLQSFCLPVV